MSASKYILGLNIALGLPACSKDPMEKVVEDLTKTCLAVEESKAPCGYRRGDSPEMAANMHLSYSGMEAADKMLQQKTECRLLVFQNKKSGTLDYLIQRKNCDLATVHPNSDLFQNYTKIYPQ